jgi:mRNA-degrading endonuclease RelE of RelBE toxin-antitoxin system
MSLNIITLECFAKEVKKLYKKYKKLPDDLRALQGTLQENPKAGIELEEGCYKIRLANSSARTGKSGGFRVIYYYLDAHDNLYLLSIYSKTEIENISDDMLLEILKANGLAG